MELNPEKLESEYKAREGNFLPVAAQLANTFWYKRPEAAECFKKVSFLDHKPRKIKTIALHFRKIRNGGAERVVAQLASILAEMKYSNGKPKYSVVLVTDEDPQPDDYEISALVKRFKLPHCTLFPENDFLIRAQAWWEMIDKFQVDVVIHSQWFQSYALWDMLCVKSHPSKPAFVFHVHNFCGRLYSINYMDVEEMGDMFTVADAIVTLSSCDKKYWSVYNPRTFMIGNPVAFKAEPEHRTHHGREILWLGRIAEPKRPLEAVKIMKRVTEVFSDAVCRIVGNEDSDLLEKLKSEIDQAGLNENFILEGFHPDVGRFYENASVFLLTSRFEGFTLTLMEAAAHGLPIVMYDLPWLEVNKILNGLACVPQLDEGAAANEIIRLLKDKELWQERSDLLFESYAAYETSDPGKEWERVFRSIERNTCPAHAKHDPDLDILFTQIAHFHNDSRRSLLEEKNYFQRRSVERLHYARIDIKNAGSDANDLEILEITDPAAKIARPQWICRNGGGKVILSKTGNINFTVKCTGSGTFTIDLRGEDLRGANEEKIPVWVEFSALSVNGDVIFNNSHILWHNMPFKYESAAEDGQVFTVSVEWNRDYIGIGKNQSLIDEVEMLSAENIKLKKQLENIRNILNE